VRNQATLGEVGELGFILLLRTQTRAYTDSLELSGTHISPGRADRWASDWSLLWGETHPSLSLCHRGREGTHRVDKRAPVHHGRKLFKTYGPRLYAQNFKMGFSGDYEIKMAPGKLPTLCELEWSSFGVDWPSEGTLELPTVQAIYRVVVRTPGHPDQFPYIDSWLQIAQTLPPWVRFCTNRKGQSRISVTQVKEPKGCKKVKPVYQGDSETEDNPFMPRPYAPSAPPLRLEILGPG